MKKLSLLLIVLFTLTVAEARPISEQEARQKAYQFFGNVGPKRMNKAKAKTPLKTPELTLAISCDEFYVFNDEANGGYVIVSGDERLPHFLGYSYDGHFNADNIHCNVQAWLEGYVDQIRFLQEHPEVHSDSRQEVVKDYIPPLLNSHWNQRAPYNLRCPIIKGAHSVTGCVATAMAQVMYYYQWPEQTLQPIPSYTTSTNKITVPEQPVTRIDWQNMLPVYGSYSEKQADAVATLMLLCGAAVKMDYGLGDSSASVSGDAFEKYFDYYGGERIFRNDYDNQTWWQLLYEELKDGHPVLYNGFGEKGGHQFILDGYEVMDNGEIAEPYYHVNFGWSGTGDAYYSLNNVHGYNNGQYAIVGLRPNRPDTKLPYAVLDKGKLTFYCDTKKKDRSGKAFLIKAIKDQQKVTECEIDASFVDYRMTNCSSLFWGYTNLRSIKGLENLNTKYVTNMRSMFSGCSNLTSLDVSGFNTENVTDMYYMFCGCSNLTSLDVSGFNTEKVTNMRIMFYGCSSLTNLNLSGFNTEKVNDMFAMFYDCSNLTNLDVSGFNTENVTNMGYMFSGCSNLTSLDVSGFNTENVKDMSGMFSGCSGLTTIYASSEWSTEKVTNGSNMFYGCTNLVGGKGTTFDWGHTDYIYARIDGGPEAPGYFTFKQNSGIKNLLTNEDKEKSIYSLGGQRLPTPQKGINIIGGKKVIVRSTPFLGR